MIGKDVHPIAKDLASTAQSNYFTLGHPQRHEKIPNYLQSP